MKTKISYNNSNFNGNSTNFGRKDIYGIETRYKKKMHPSEVVEQDQQQQVLVAARATATLVQLRNLHLLLEAARRQQQQQQQNTNSR